MQIEEEIREGKEKIVQTYPIGHVSEIAFLNWEGVKLQCFLKTLLNEDLELNPAS